MTPAQKAAADAAYAALPGMGRLAPDRDVEAAVRGAEAWSATVRHLQIMADAGDVIACMNLPSARRMETRMKDRLADMLGAFPVEEPRG